MPTPIRGIMSRENQITSPVLLLFSTFDSGWRSHMFPTVVLNWTSSGQTNPTCFLYQGNWGRAFSRFRSNSNLSYCCLAIDTMVGYFRTCQDVAFPPFTLHSPLRSLNLLPWLKNAPLSCTYLLLCWCLDWVVNTDISFELFRLHTCKELQGLCPRKHRAKEYKEDLVLVPRRWFWKWCSDGGENALLPSEEHACSKPTCDAVIESFSYT